MTVCLAMMARNEAQYIRSALQSVKPYITHWSVFMAGESTDGTQDIVREQMRGIPGVLTEGAWEGWDKSRTKSIYLAKQSGCDWVLLLDADETFSVPDGFRWPILDPNVAYWATVQYGGIRYTRPNLLSVKHNWRYVGVTHEYLMAPENPKQELLPITLVTHPARADKTAAQCLQDAKLLEDALLSEPENVRYVFYLANSYKDSLQPEKAIEMYKKRAAMGGWAEEVYISLLRVAQLSEGRQAFPEVVAAYVAAQEYRPSRAGETMNNLARYCKWWADGTAYPSEDRLFIDASCYKLQPARKVNPIKVAVIIPTQHRRDELLEESLVSIARQTRQPDKTVVADSAAPLVERLNTAIRESGCDAFVVLGDDDLLEPAFIERTAGLMESSGADIVHTLYSHFGDETCVTGSTNHISTTSLCRKSIWEKVGGFADVAYWDWDLWWSCIDAGAKKEFIPEPLWKYRIHPQQAGKQDTEAEKEKYRAIIMARHERRVA